MAWIILNTVYKSPNMRIKIKTYFFFIHSYYLPYLLSMSVFFIAHLYTSIYVNYSKKRNANKQKW